MVDDVADRVRPAIIINTAVIGVDQCERDPSLAMRVNADGPEFLGQAAERIDAAIVHFSSNYVFDGRPLKRQPYRVGDEPRPINIYGKTKLIGERAVAATSSRAYIIRTSWVYGPGKRSFLATVAERLQRGERVQAISDTWASTTYVPDLAQRVMEIVRADRPGLYHVVNDGICSYETFARRAAHVAGIPDQVADRLIEVVSETTMQREAPRPPWSPMLCVPPMRSWEDALAAYVTASRR